MCQGRKEFYDGTSCTGCDATGLDYSVIKVGDGTDEVWYRASSVETMVERIRLTSTAHFQLPAFQREMALLNDKAPRGPFRCVLHMTQCPGNCWERGVCAQHEGEEE